MPRARVAQGDFSLDAVQPADIESIRQWRNAQIDILRQSAPISMAQQVEYYASCIWPTMAEAHPGNILLAYRRKGELIGYGGLVHVAWQHRRAEVSFLLEPRLANVPESYAEHFSRFLRLLKEVAFDDLGIERLFTETYAFRAAHMAVLEGEGFRREGELRGHVIVDGVHVDSILHGCLRSEQAARA